MNDEEAEGELHQIVLKFEPLIYRDEQVKLSLDEAQQDVILILISTQRRRQLLPRARQIARQLSDQHKRLKRLA